MKLELNTTIQMARIAGAMYERTPPEADKADRPDLRLTECKVFRSRRVRCMVGLWRSTGRASVVVAFRGSSNGWEWANNAHPAEWRQVSPSIAGRVHPGLIDSLADVWPQAEKHIDLLIGSHLNELMSHYGRSVPICLVGHSRGGALAVLAGRQSLMRFVLPVNIYSFGAPRMGTPEFATGLNETFRCGCSEHWRLECRPDPIPVFPFVTVAAHTGTLVYLTPGSDTVEVVHSERHAASRAARCLAAHPRRNHRMISYLKTLGEAVAVMEIPASGRPRKKPTTVGTHDTQKDSAA